jgi:trans-2,3-dihydro-3-hydroxyanthranilate isomerase
VQHRVAFLDVFAERPLAGNGLAVVDEADGLSDETMLAFAAETRLSETTFLQTPSDGSADYRNRIWTPSEELPFAGHPSLGTAVAVARWRGSAEAKLVQETKSGVQPIEVHFVAEDESEGERWTASMLQAPTEYGAELDPKATMEAVGLELRDARAELPPQIVSTGLRHAIAPVADASALGRVRPDYPAIDQLLAPHDAVVIYLTWCEGEIGKARAFSRIVELAEDPATGSAAGPLCAYLADREGQTRITVEQGVEMGRPSVLHAEMEGDRVRVSGSVIPLIDGIVLLP